MTRREEITDLLKKRKWTIKQLAERFGVDLPEIIEDLEHVRRSTQPPEKFMVNPPHCHTCGFVFKERLKIKPPTKCPKCRSEAITHAEFFITHRKSRIK